MNIQLIPEHIQLKAVDAEGAYFDIVDTIGYSSGNTDNGFSHPDHLYMDSQGEVYPLIQGAAMFLYVVKNSFDGSKLPCLVTGSPLRVASYLTEYSEISYQFRVTMSGDAWYSAHTFLMPVGSGSNQVYYDAGTEKIMDPNGITEYTIEQLLVNTHGVQTTETQFLLTPILEGALIEKLGDLADTGMIVGKCSKDYTDLLYNIQFVEGQLAGARVKFNSGYYTRGQQLIEDLLNSNPYESC